METILPTVCTLESEALQLSILAGIAPPRPSLLFLLLTRSPSFSTDVGLGLSAVSLSAFSLPLSLSVCLSRLSLHLSGPVLLLVLCCSASLRPSTVPSSSLSLFCSLPVGLSFLSLQSICPPVELYALSAGGCLCVLCVSLSRSRSLSFLAIMFLKLVPIGIL